MSCGTFSQRHQCLALDYFLERVHVPVALRVHIHRSRLEGSPFFTRFSSVYVLSFKKKDYGNAPMKFLGLWYTYNSRTRISN